MKNVIELLRERGFIEDVTSPELTALANNPMKVYCGFDPSADSLHLGNLVGIMGLAWFKRFGHQVYAIVGGATGMIGDPSGKSAERQLLDEATIEKNLKGISKNIESVLSASEGNGGVTFLNNLDWFKKFNYIDFLRDVGKFFRVGPMLAKDSVKSRMESEEGISYTEFSYQALQGYDFLHLFREHGVTVQLGGSDQWGNITAGTELIRKVTGKSAHGITFPLITRSDGKKFGKSEKGAVWLSGEKLSPYEFYQYLVRIADSDVIKLMRMLTFMEMAEIQAYEEAMLSSNYIPNTAQKRLAQEVTLLVHGKNGLESALKATEGAAPGANTVLDAAVLEGLAAEMPSCVLARADVVSCKLVDLLVKVSLQTSKSEARRLIKNGGVYLNNEKITDENFVLSPQHLLENRMLLLAAGKKNKLLVRIQET